MNYFEFNERRTQGSVAVDVVEWPEITVTESEPNEDQLLELSLMKHAVCMCPCGVCVAEALNVGVQCKQESS